MDAALLRATLLRGEGGRQAWEDWCRVVGDPVRALGADVRHIKVLVPLLASNLRANAVDIPRSFATYAKAAHLTEAMRMTAYGRECGRVLSLLNSHGLDQVVMKGAALAATVYSDPALRHAHDFDVLVRQQDLTRAEHVMRLNGFSASRRVGDDLHHLAPLANALGFTVELHRRPAQIYPGFDAAGVWTRSVSARVAGCDTRVPSRADSLLLAALHAATGGAGNVRWVCDVWLLAEGLGRPDWNLLADIALDSSASLPLALVLGYISDSIGPVVPPEILDRVTEDAARTDATGRQALTFGARQALPQDLNGILQLDGTWRERFDQLAWRLAPPPTHVRWAIGCTRRWQVLGYYPFRLLRLASQAALAGRD